MERFLVMLKFSCNIAYIPVSVDSIENYMPEANGAYVKVYLLALSLAGYGYEMSASSIASQLNLIKCTMLVKSFGSAVSGIAAFTITIDQLKMKEVEALTNELEIKRNEALALYEK